MNCPYCGSEMEKGLIQNQYEVAWLKGDKRRHFGRAKFYKGSVVLSKFSFMNGSAVEAYLCGNCRKVIIDYSDSRSDFNQR